MFSNPLLTYLRWISYKIYYQLKYWGDHVRISYGTIIRNSTFWRYNWIGNYNIILQCQIGDHTFIKGFSSLLNCKVGKYCSIASNVKISPGSHPTSTFVSTHPSTYSSPPFHAIKYTTKDLFKYNKKVEIGNDVWIGANVLIVGGITIGDGAIIAANAVVTKNVGDYEIVGGVPAKFIKKRFTDNEIKSLKEIKWWDKDEAWMRKNIAEFSSISRFVDFYENGL